MADQEQIKSNAWQVRQVFVQGLRFDGELKYRGQRGWHRLVMEAPDRASMAKLADRQAMALVSGRPWSSVHQSDHRAMGVRRHHTSLQGTKRSNNPRELGQALKVLAMAVSAGQVATLTLWSPTLGSWTVLVTGVEWRRPLPLADDRSDASTLLLLDPFSAPPWCCGHNARLPLTPSRGASGTRVLRSLSGEARSVQLKGWTRFEMA